VAARSKAWNVFARSQAEIVVSNPTQGVDVCLRLFCFFCCPVQVAALCRADYLYRLDPTEQVLPEDGDRIRSPKRYILKEKQDDILNKDKTMNNVQRRNIHKTVYKETMSPA
jgi:hypothetical protein